MILYNLQLTEIWFLKYQLVLLLVLSFFSTLQFGKGVTGDILLPRAVF